MANFFPDMRCQQIWLPIIKLRKKKTFPVLHSTVDIGVNMTSEARRSLQNSSNELYSTTST